MVLGFGLELEPDLYTSLPILSADIGLSQTYRYPCICSPISANIKTVI